MNSNSPSVSFYRERYSVGTMSHRDLNEANSLNKQYKDRLLNSNFDLGGKLLISPDVDGPIRLLESEKRATYFKEKVLSSEQNAMRQKFKDKIERQNWSIKSLEKDHSLLNATNLNINNTSFAMDKPRVRLADSLKGSDKLQSNFMLGYTNARYDSISKD
mmetsp:Transcript_44545/g.43207  ORF Transcript_44545/g.43207 Transcript_44545/m.43207 type:complete len:160 (+) Transcript_44545:3-482(+)